MTTVVVNGAKREVQAPTDTPLLYVLRNDLELSGPQFGCGLAQCGACSVLLDGKEVRSCITPLAAVAGKEVTTLEGLPARWAKQKGLSEEAGGKDSSPGASGLDRRADSSVRVLSERHDDQSDGTAGTQLIPHCCHRSKRHLPQVFLRISAVAAVIQRSSRLCSVLELP